MFREYFLVANGTKEGQWGMEDEDLVSFWHFAQIRPLSEPWPSLPASEASGLFVFADWSIDAHQWAIRLNADAAAPAPIFITYDPVQPVAASFEQFLDGKPRTCKGRSEDRPLRVAGAGLKTGGYFPVTILSRRVTGS